MANVRRIFVRKDGGWVLDMHQNDDQITPAAEAGLLAHDLIEHIKHKNIGGIVDEFKALGVMVYGRGMQGYLGSWSMPMNLSVAYGMADVFRYIQELEDVPPCRGPLRETDAYWEIEAVGDNLTLDKVANEADHLLEYFDKKAVKAMMKNAIRWMQRGALEAERHYGSSWDTYNAYESIKYHLEESPMFKHGHEDGDRFVIGFNNRTGEVNCINEMRSEWA